MTTDPGAVSELILYGKPGCHLCEDARDLLIRLLDARRLEGLRTPAVVERNILTNADWQRAYFETIPVLEMAGRQLPLAIRPRQVAAFLEEALADETSLDAPRADAGRADAARAGAAPADAPAAPAGPR